MITGRWAFEDRRVNVIGVHELGKPDFPSLVSWTYHCTDSRRGLLHGVLHRPGG